MGCLDSVPDDSPESRVRDREDVLKLTHHTGNDVKASFFYINNGNFSSMSQSQFDDGWAKL